MGNLIITLADVVLLLVLALFALWGWKSGFLKMGFGLVSFVAAILLGRLLYPVIADFLRDTPVYTGILSVAQRQTEIGGAEPAGGVMASLMEKSGELLSGYLAELALSVIAFLLVVVVVKILLMVVSRALRLFTSLPVVGLVNRLAGLALGVIEGLIIVTVLLAGIYVIAPLRETPQVSREIEKSIVVRDWYLNNPLVLWLDGDNIER